jgi:hypothetical protein
MDRGVLFFLELNALAHLGNNNLALGSKLFQMLTEGQGLVFFAVGDQNFLEAAFDIADIVQQFIAVGMTGK